MTEANPTKASSSSSTVPEAGEKSSLSEAEKFLESLNLNDTESTNHPSTSHVTAASTDPKDIMSFLDEIAQYPADTSSRDEAKPNVENPKAETKSSSSSWMAWGNSLWSQASAAVKTTTEQLNRSAADIPAAKLLEERVRGLVNKYSLGKLGNELRQLTNTILETVAPPISEHELVEVWLSHDMVGYAGLEALVYRAFARVMEQTESGHIVVHRARKQEQDVDDGTRNLNMCEGIVEGTKLAKANIDHFIKLHYTPPETRTEYTPQSGAVPVINCPVFLAIQPVKFALPVEQEEEGGNQLVYIILLEDPTHQIKFKTYSQSIPLEWLDVPYEENEWVEDKMTEVIRMAVTTIAQDYVWTRMTGVKNQIAKAVTEASKATDGKSETSK